MHLSPRCGAKARTRSGEPCRSPAMANGRCRMHGGKSTGAPKGREHYAYQHGLYTKEAVEERRLVRELLEAADRTVRELS
ncbi:MAG: HGGxSTG domain-containing protein [Kiloniellaceae bacterium]